MTYSCKLNFTEMLGKITFFEHPTRLLGHFRTKNINLNSLWNSPMTVIYERMDLKT
jgi:hypothetical protein